MTIADLARDLAGPLLVLFGCAMLYAAFAGDRE